MIESEKKTVPENTEPQEEKAPSSGIFVFRVSPSKRGAALKVFFAGVLALLHRRDCYGCEISELLAQRIAIADGTVYPLLRKLKADGLLTTYLQEESGGPPRKYYKLTELGRESYQRDCAEYLKFAQSVRELLEDANHDEA